MSPLLVLPAPLPSTALTLGQLITDPLANKSASLQPSRAPPSKQTTQSKYKDTIAYDNNGRFTSTHSLSNPNGQAPPSHSNLLDLTADQMTHTTLDQPITFFNQLRRDNTTHTFLRKMTQEKTPVYFVTSLQTVRNPVFKRVVGNQGSTTTTTEDTPESPHFRLLVRRVDSASDMNASSTTNSQQDDECVLAVELRKVKCRLGASNEPHSLEDIGFEWSYHGDVDELDEDEQLAIGLGKPLEAKELKALAGMPLKENTTTADEERLGEESEYPEDDGIGGF